MIMVTAVVKVYIVMDKVYAIATKVTDITRGECSHHPHLRVRKMLCTVRGSVEPTHALRR